MTEPVAYMWKTAQGTIIGLSPNDNSHSGGRLGIPLYTSEQLHPCVKMTKEQWDEFNEIRNESLRFSDLWITVFEQGKAWHSIVDLSEKNLMLAWLDDEVVEIVPNMKWFVRSKEKTQGFYMFLGNLNELRDPWIFTKQDNFTSFAQQFDTKEEAEKWVNPLTEAVQLPVEEE